jgi:hypothetical protein
MIIHIVETCPNIYDVSTQMMATQKDPSLLKLFSGAGNDDARAEIFSLLSKKKEMVKVLRVWKLQIIRDICKRGHSKLFSKVIKMLKVRGKDLDGQKGDTNCCVASVLCYLHWLFIIYRLSLCIVDGLQYWQ